VHVEGAAADDYQHTIEGQQGFWLLHLDRCLNRFSASRWGASDRKLRNTH
jgi:hypothetical protein